MPMVSMTVAELIAYEDWKGGKVPLGVGSADALTQRQHNILTFICNFSQKGFPPTIREIGEAFGIKSTNGVNDHLKALERKGWILRAETTARGIKILVRP